jgi:uncharacterized protein YceK
MKKIALITAALSVSLLSGCATILNDDLQKVNLVTSNGEKADLQVNGQTVTAPTVIDVKRTKDALMITSTDGKCAQSTVANSKVDPVFFVNILSGGAFGSTTDYSTEKMWQYEDKIEVNCK